MNAPLSMKRTGRITGSRVAGVLGLSPYMTRSNVMREMVRQFHWADEEFTGNFVTDYGREHEPDAVHAYEVKTGYTVENAGDMQLTVVSDDQMFAYTPDGWITDQGDPEGDGLDEFKAPFRSTYTHWKQRPDYYAQMQLGMATTGRGWCDFGVWRYEGLSLTRCYYDEDWLPSVLPEIEQFLEEYNRTIASEELSAPHLAEIVDQRTDDEWLAAVAEYYDVLADVQHSQGELGKAKEVLQKLAGDATAKGGGLQVIRRVSSAGAGSVSYKKAFEELAERLELTSEEQALIKSRHSGKGSSGGGITWAYKNIQDKED